MKGGFFKGKGENGFRKLQLTQEKDTKKNQ